MNDPIPVALFAYARPTHLARVLDCLRADNVPLIYAFSDGARSAADAPAVTGVRDLLHAVGWAEVRLVERAENLGLGRSILAGVTEVASQHDAFLVWEDDLVCAPGTYPWLCAALKRYADDTRVFSVAGWTHPEIGSGGPAPAFDQRAESWIWGGYSRSWPGMDEPALSKLGACRKRGIHPYDHGLDLAVMAHDEARKNLWAVRWILHHFQNGKLCVRPPRSLVEHIGDDAQATNVRDDNAWRGQPVVPTPVPPAWPEPVVDPGTAARWRTATWRRMAWRQRMRALFYQWL